MSGSNSARDSMEWGRGRSTGSRKGKRTGNSSSDKPRQPQRGLGVAQLEKIRIESEMAEHLHHPLGHRSPIHRTGGSFNWEDVRLAHSLPSSPSSSFHANISVPSSYPIHRSNPAMAYGETGDIRYGAEIQTDPLIIRSPYYSGANFASEALRHSHQSTVTTLPLFEPEIQHDMNQSADSLLNPAGGDDDQQEVDLELKL